MLTLIIPCAGRTMLNGKPKFLIQHPDGQLLVRKCIDGIPLDTFDRILITVLQDDVDVWKADLIIREAFSDIKNSEIVILSHETSGPAETVYHTIKRAKVNGAIVIKDSDNYLKVSEIPYLNFAAGLDLDEWDRDIHNLRNKSFIILNEQKQILDIFEKQFRSDVICLGMYGFADTSDFIFAYEHLDDPSYPIQKLYVSHIISYLIGFSQKVFYYLPCQKYENWGNGKVWNGVQRDYATYFINLDATGMCDSDLKDLLLLQERGACFIGYTSSGIEKKEEIKRQAEEYGIRFLEIVCGCTCSNIKEIIDGRDKLIALRDEVS